MYLNLTQIAEAFGVSEHTIIDWVRKEGMPHVHDRDRRLFERTLVMSWAASHGIVPRAEFLSQTAMVMGTGPELEILLRRGGIWHDVAPRDLPTMLNRIVGSLPGVTDEARNLLAARLAAPEGVSVSPVGKGVGLALPTISFFFGGSSSLAALIRLSAPWPDTDPPDGLPVNTLLFFISPTPRKHVILLSRLEQAVTTTGIDRALQDGADDETLIRILADATASPAGTREGVR